MENQKSFSIRLEQLLYGFAFLTALVLRLTRLGGQPLNDAEASLGLQAFQLFQNRLLSGISSEPLYGFLTGLSFAIFKSNEFVARFWPAVIGALLVFAPYFLRNIIGRKASILLSFGIAIDAALVAVSRQADGLSLSIVLGMAVLLAFSGRSAAVKGILMGLFLISGQGLWFGLLGILLSWLVYRLLNKSSVHEISATFSFGEGLTKVVFWCVGTILAMGTVFMASPGLLSAVPGSFVAFFQGWSTPSGNSLSQLLIAGLAYQIFPVLLGIAGAIQNIKKKSKFDLFLTLWWGISLLLVLVYPSRQVADLAWSSIPAWILAARFLENGLAFDFRDKKISVIQSIGTIVLIGFSWLSFTSFLQNPAEDAAWRGMLSIAIAVVMLAAIYYLVRIGWSPQVANHGTLWGICVPLLVITFSMSWNGAGLGIYPENQAWQQAPYPKEMKLLVQTIDEVSRWNIGQNTMLDVVVVGQDSPSIRWELRNYPYVQYLEALPLGSSPSLAITSDLADLALSSTYRGQDFVIRSTPEWNAMTNDEWLRWIAFRKVPSGVERVILWVRTDLFAGSGGQP